MCESHPQAVAHFVLVTELVFKQDMRVLFGSQGFSECSSYSQLLDFEIY